MLRELGNQDSALSTNHLTKADSNHNKRAALQHQIHTQRQNNGNLKKSFLEKYATTSVIKIQAAHISNLNY